MAQADLVMWFVSTAVEKYGGRVLAGGNDEGAAIPEVVGRELARLMFGVVESDARLPIPLAALTDDLDNWQARSALECFLEDRLEADPELARRVAEVLAAYYQRCLESGDGRALAELGDLLWFDEPELARAAFERAVTAGNQSAVIRLAEHRMVVFGDYEGALPLYQLAVDDQEPRIVARALAALGSAHEAHGDLEAARAVWERCIATGDADWAPRAMALLANLLDREFGDEDKAKAMFRAAFDSGHPEVASRAMLRLGLLLEQEQDDDGALTAYELAANTAPAGCRGSALLHLADLLARRGDTSAAKAVWQQVIIAETDEGAPEGALVKLLNQLDREGDLEGLRHACQTGFDKGLQGSPYGFVVIGKVLRERGDLDGWRDAWQEAIDAGYEDADILLDEMRPPKQG